MRGLALILAEGGGARVETALEAAAAAAALGEPVRLFLAREAVMLAAGGAAPLTTLLELGAAVSACQTAMAAAGLAPADLPASVAPSGLVAFLAETGDFRLLLA
jgi:peroxiredoxin family protein